MYFTTQKKQFSYRIMWDRVEDPCLTGKMFSYAIKNEAFLKKINTETQSKWSGSWFTQCGQVIEPTFQVIWINIYRFPSSVQFSRSVVSDSLWPHESQHARPPCPSPTPGVHSDSHPSSQWCHPAISSFVVPFPPCPQSRPAPESFLMSQLFTWGDQSTGVSALA